MNDVIFEMESHIWYNVIMACTHLYENEVETVIILQSQDVRICVISEGERGNPVEL